MSKKSEKATEIAETPPKAAATKAEGRSLQAIVNYSRRATPDSDQGKSDQR
ncbi:hypothetical protein [Streptomyces sp. NPDC001194]|uniref:hypothetical protein n=1 Tax=Streptomyces sp. NPDC001194 TaxID=3364547 RepID=UPI00367E587C